MISIFTKSPQPTFPRQARYAHGLLCSARA